MKPKETVEYYLNDLFAKIDIFDIVIEGRNEFHELQKELELTQSECKKYIRALTYKDYLKGPTMDTINKGEYWEFGKKIKSADVYIKINKGKARKSAICISFHKANFKMTFPLINK
ncbi:MAG: toxin [Candidatus Kapaibacterium sp.]